MHSLDIFLLVFAVLSLLTAIYGAWVFIVAAFRHSLSWGLAVLLLPFAGLFFLILYWDEGKRGFLLNLAGSLSIIAMAFVLPARVSHLKARCIGASQPAAVSAPSRIKELDSQIEAKHLAVLQLESTCSESATALSSRYEEITAKRKALNVNDAAAVQQFNADAAAYQQLNSQVKQMALDLTAAKQELDDLIKERSALSVSKPTPSQQNVVIYTTSHCGYCARAKQYLAQRGISYREIDIESSSEARQEFKRLGGNGVPLIFVGNRRIEGFDQGALAQALP